MAVNTKVLRDNDIREPLFDFQEEKLGKIRILKEEQTGRARADVVSYRKEAPCKNTYVYETARAWHVKEVMRRALKPEVVEDFLGIIEKKVKDPERKEKVKEAVKGIMDKPAEALFYDDEDFLLATKEIRFFPENVIRAEMIDGSVREMALNPCWPEKERKRKKKTI